MTPARLVALLSPRARAALAGLGAALLLALALQPGELGPAAARAGAVAAALWAAVLLVRRARATPSAPRRLAVLAREPLGRDAGLALAELDGRPLLIGFGPGGVHLLAAPEPPRTADPGARP